MNNIGDAVGARHLDDGPLPAVAEQKDLLEARRLSVQRCIQSLVHVSQCRNANCELSRCQKMKRVVLHTKHCKLKANGDCPTCKQLAALCCYHARHCGEVECLVPFCSNLKHILRNYQLDQRLRRAQLLRRQGF